MMNTMFDTLLQLPLFQGLSQEDFTNILAKVKLHFTRLKTGEVIIRKGMPCNQLYFILKGEVSATSTSNDSLYSFIEYFQAPYLIEPQSMFGMQTEFFSKYVAHTDVSMVTISKSCVLNELFNYEIFRLNYLNIISNYAQTQNNHLWDPMPDTLEERIRHFIRTHLKRRTGEKIFKIKMEDLAGIVNDTRSNVSKVLNNMQNEGLIELHRGEMAIPDVEKLLS